jgi:hypothetical protein
MHLCGTYILNDKRESRIFPGSVTHFLMATDGNGGEIFWPVLGSAIKVAQGVSIWYERPTFPNNSNQLGLHRDGAAFGLSELEIEERRLVWWELVVSFFPAMLDVGLNIAIDIRSLASDVLRAVSRVMIHDNQQH